MITTKQRAHLRALCNTLKPQVIIGKGDLTDNIVAEIATALHHNELVKVQALKSCTLTSRQMSNIVCDMLSCDAVQCVGNVFSVYKRTDKKDFEHIVLPR